MAVRQETRENSREAFQLQARFTRVMGNPVRLMILHALHQANGHLSSAELLEITGVSKGSLSQHLGKMADVGLVHTHMDGRRLHVELASLEIGKACDIVRRVLAQGARRKASTLQP